MDKKEDVIMKNCKWCGKGLIEDNSNFCSQLCQNNYISDHNINNLSPTNMQQPPSSLNVHDVLRNGKMHGTMQIDDIRFAIICDHKVDNQHLKFAAQAFVESFKKWNE